jgi:hypothetical protein
MEKYAGRWGIRAQEKHGGSKIHASSFHGLIFLISDLYQRQIFMSVENNKHKLCLQPNLCCECPLPVTILIITLSSLHEPP